MNEFDKQRGVQNSQTFHRQLKTVPANITDYYSRHRSNEHFLYLTLEFSFFWLSKFLFLFTLVRLVFVFIQLWFAFIIVSENKILAKPPAVDIPPDITPTENPP